MSVDRPPCLSPRCAAAAMAAMTVEQMSDLLQSLATLVQSLAQTQAASIPVGSSANGMSKGRSISTKAFSKMSRFSKGETEWKEWYFDFGVILGAESPDMLKVLKVLENLTEEADTPKVKAMDMDFMDRINIEKLSKELFETLVVLTEGEAKMMVRGVASQDGVLAWHRLYRHYNRRTLARVLRMHREAMHPKAVPDLSSLISRIVEWEDKWDRMAKEHKTQMPTLWKMAAFMELCPPEVQNMVYQSIDECEEDYEKMKQRVMSWVSNKVAQAGGPTPMDIGQFATYGEGEEEYVDGEDIGAVSNMQCHGCGGWGHFKRDCPYGAKGKGKSKGKGEKGKGKGTYEKGKGKGHDGKGGKGGSRVPCPGCGKLGHTAANCWTLNPGSYPWRPAGAVDYDDGETEREIGLLESVCEPCGWEQVPFRNGRKKADGDQKVRDDARLPRSDGALKSPPGLEDEGEWAEIGRKNPFQALAEDDVDRSTMAIDFEVEERAVAHVVKSGKLVPAGKGKITIDSGAAESVMPKGMLPNEPAVEGMAKRNGVRYVAANGARMENMGEKRTRFRTGGAKAINGITFQVTDVSKPLASVSRILDKGNRVVFSRGPEGSYIENNETGEWFQLKEERGTFVLEVDWLEPEAIQEGESRASGFPRQGK